MSDGFPTPGLLVHLVCATGEDNPQPCIDWAIEALCAGADTPSLRVLAGLPVNSIPYEVQDYCVRSFRELGIRILRREDLAILLARSIAEELLREPDKTSGLLLALQEFWQQHEYDFLYDFYLLSYAWSDLYEWDQSFSGYWKDATPETMPEIVRDYCVRWLAEHPDPRFADDEN